MKTLDTDNELKTLIKGIKLDSPGNDFTSKVMNRVFEEKPLVEIVKNEKLLGNSFWVILSLFALLFLVMLILTGTGIEQNGQLSDYFGKLNNSSIASNFQSAFGKLGNLPLSIGGILFATSILLFADKFISQFVSHQTAQKAI